MESRIYSMILCSPSPGTCGAKTRQKRREVGLSATATEYALVQLRHVRRTSCPLKTTCTPCHAESPDTFLFTKYFNCSDSLAMKGVPGVQKTCEFVHNVKNNNVKTNPGWCNYCRRPPWRVGSRLCAAPFQCSLVFPWQPWTCEIAGKCGSGQQS